MKETDQFGDGGDGRSPRCAVPHLRAVGVGGRAASRGVDMVGGAGRGVGLSSARNILSCAQHYIARTA